MKIEFKNGKLRKVCENETKLRRLYGSICANRIIQQINELDAAENLYDIS